MRSRITRIGLAAVVVLALAGAARAQDQAAALEQIPPGVAAFVVVDNLAQTGASLDQFIADVGLGRMMPGSVLNVLKQQMGIQQGLDDQGSFALVVLDPSRFGWGAAEMTGQAPPPGPLPIVLVIPASDPASLFANFETAQEGDYLQVMLDGEPWVAQARQGMTVLAPQPRMIETLAASEESVTGQMPEQHLAVIRKAGLSGYADMQVLQGFMLASIDQAEQQMAQMEEGGFLPPPMLVVIRAYQALLPMYREIIPQMQGISLNLAVTQPGLVLREYVTYVPDSDLGRLMEAMDAEGAGFSHLPDLKYVLAMAANWSWPEDEQAVGLWEQMARDFMVRFLTAMDVPEQPRQQAVEAYLALATQMSRYEIYAGGAVEDEPGVFGLATVMEVEDQQAALEQIRNLTESVFTMLQSMRPEVVTAEEPAETAEDRLRLQWQESSQEVEGVSVTAVVLEGANLTEGDAEEMEKLRTILGEERAVFYVAPVGENLIVVTYGGGQPFLAQAIRGAQSDESAIEPGPQVNAVLDELPGEPMFVGLFSVANLIDVMKTGMQQVSPERYEYHPLANIEFQADTPLAMAAGIEGTGVHYVVFVPTEVVGETVRLWQQMMAGPPQREQEEIEEVEEDEEF